MGYVGNFDFKNGYTNLAKCELKKMRCQSVLAHYVMLLILLNTLLINMSDITAYL